LPFRKTYLKSGVGDRLVTTGMYAIVRHPGVLSVTMLLAALVLMSRSQALLIAAPIFVALDVLLVYLQDRYFFRLMFKGYNEYRQQTPMLIPNYKSLKIFINSLRETGVVSNMEEK
jgi:protein-S-isoprenylcysteine O-methyltransferase Ste14